ncbi:MAG: hypothetical protein Q9223_001133 [Gallowayella weberi]
MAIKRQSDITNLQDQLNSTRMAFEKYTADSCNNHPNFPNSSAIVDRQPAKISDITPTTNCTDIGDNKKYVAAFTQMPFIVHCDTDYPGSDMLGIWTFTFADCIEACASWNSHHMTTQRCYSVSYDYSNVGAFVHGSGIGNCFFKDNSNIQPRYKNVTSSADAQLGTSSG